MFFWKDGPFCGKCMGKSTKLGSDVEGGCVKSLNLKIPLTMAGVRAMIQANQMVEARKVKSTADIGRQRLSVRKGPAAEMEGAFAGVPVGLL